MLEWMHDPSVVENLQADFASKTLEDCTEFIQEAQSCQTALHLAIVDDADTYMGTVSLKHIENGTAEFAISVRRAAMGKGYAAYGMKTILTYGIQQLGLQAIYWCVSPENQRAVRFYDKNRYRRTELIPKKLASRYHQDLIWYAVCETDTGFKSKQAMGAEQGGFSEGLD